MISTNLTIIANEMKKFSFDRYSSHKARIPDMTFKRQNTLYVVLTFSLSAVAPLVQLIYHA
ncbi:hypothetical protein K450DRAFT_257254 [Umbelopsis ramanniana AG]|uniref:Uncharacterized protein n=1 Tax=Umbelopsis ramanniana AG TaxID=1314678 RepID=A0AAD5H9V9_UMBRA|nr:uncharacterized protein K450DRAFT_257254 [Umbelopsis ramanniana AG]KAI8576332.1 hypothetical protein K450DRAFT_257254 [Umbelopsis ramanniana AG]